MASSLSCTRRNSTSTSFTLTETTGKPRVSRAGNTLPCAAKPTAGSSGPVKMSLLVWLPRVSPSMAASSAFTCTLYEALACTNGKRRVLPSSFSAQLPLTVAPWLSFTLIRSSKDCVPTSALGNSRVSASCPRDISARAEMISKRASASGLAGSAATGVVPWVSGTGVVCLPQPPSNTSELAIKAPAAARHPRFLCNVVMACFPCGIRRQYSGAIWPSSGRKRHLPDQMRLHPGVAFCGGERDACRGPSRGRHVWAGRA